MQRGKHQSSCDHRSHHSQLVTQLRLLLFGRIPVWHQARKHQHRLQHMPSLLQRGALENALKQLWVLNALDIDGGIKHA